MRILGIDPGVARSHWFIIDTNRLSEAVGGFVHPEDACTVVELAKTVDAVVVEGQHMTAASVASDIIALAVAAGRIAGAAATVCDRVEMPKAIQWKGNVPKKIHNDRVKKKLDMRGARTTDLKNNHIIDAAGLALWYWDRATV